MDKESSHEVNLNEKKVTKAELKGYKRHIKAGFGEYLLTRGGKAVIIFAGIIFIFNYFGIFGEKVGSAGWYIFYGVFFGFFVALWGWHNMKKMIEEYGRKK